MGILLEECPEDDDTGTGCILDLNLPIQSSLQTILFELAHKTMNHSEELFLRYSVAAGTSFLKQVKSNCTKTSMWSLRGRKDQMV